MNEKTARLEHFRKYIKSSKEIAEMSDIEYDLWILECKNNKMEIENEYRK
jgi:hypothetical protein